MTRVFLIIILLLPFQISSSQDKVLKKALLAIDTTQSKLFQAKQIYQWVTTNIRYDVNAYLMGQPHNQSIQETLNKKKGICYDYALLFKEMCNSIDIECYLIYGYTKGAELYKANKFYKADHCWNALYIDSTWILVDPTWGSGYLDRKPVWFDKIKHKLFGIMYVNKKIKFIKAPNDEYFNANNEYWNLTHLPLDPKWQLKKNPFAIKSFEEDTLKYTIILTHYLEKLQSGRNLSYPEQYFEEGIQGKDFNPRNNFDLASGYLLKAQNKAFTGILSTELQANEAAEYLDYYKKANEFISIHKDTIDSVFSSRIHMIKLGLKNGQRMSATIARDYKIRLKRFDKTQYSLSRRLAILRKKIGYFEWQISLLNGSSFSRITHGRGPTLDSLQQIWNTEMLKKSIVKCEAYKLKINQLFEKTIPLILKDSALTTICLEAKKTVNDSVRHFVLPLLYEDNRIIYPAWNGLYAIFQSCNNLYRKKALNLLVIQSNYFEMISNLSELRYEYNYQQELIRKYYKYSHDSLGTTTMYHQMIGSLIESYNKATELSNAFIEVNNRAKLFHSKNISLNYLLKQPTKHHIRLFRTYGRMLLADQERAYMVEQFQIKKISNPSARGIQMLSRKINEYNLAKRRLKAAY